MPDRLLPTMHILEAALFSSKQRPLEGIFIESKINPWFPLFQVTERLQFFYWQPVLSALELLPASPSIPARFVEV